MSKIAVLDAKGKKLEEIAVKPEIFGVTPNEGVVHQCLRNQMAAQRAGTASTKTRAEVSGGGVKPWRQKGTGRARAGSIRSPLWKGGGTVFGPRPRDYSFPMPKKVKKLALRSILSQRMAEGQFLVVDKLKFEKPKTAQAAEVLRNIKAGKTTTVVLTREEEVLAKSFRNIPGAWIAFSGELQPADLLRSETVVASLTALRGIEESLS